MVGKLEAKHTRGLADVVTLHQKTLAEIDNIGVDIADGRGAGGLVKQVAEIMRRIGHL